MNKKERLIKENSFNLEKLAKIIKETTQEFRTGPEITTRQDKNLSVVEIYAMPHESEASPELEIHDVHFMKIGIKKDKAGELKDELINILNNYPEPDRLAGGPSYIEVGGNLGSQDLALRLFALGESLGLWTIITPEKIGITGPNADQLAGSGYVMISGYKNEQ